MPIQLHRLNTLRHGESSSEQYRTVCIIGMARRLPPPPKTCSPQSGSCRYKRYKWLPLSGAYRFKDRILQRIHVAANEKRTRKIGFHVNFGSHPKTIGSSGLEKGTRQTQQNPAPEFVNGRWTLVRAGLQHSGRSSPVEKFTYTRTVSRSITLGARVRVQGEGLLQFGPKDSAH